MRLTQNANPFFQEQIKRTNSAGIEAIKQVSYALPLTFYRSHYLASQNRNRAISEIMKRAIETKNASGRLLQFFAAVARMGYRGTMIPEDVLAAQAATATGGKMAPRTARAALSALTSAGWIIKAYQPTGRRIQTPDGWKTAQIVQCVFTPALLAIIAPEAHKKRTYTDNSHPRQNLPTMGRRDQSQKPLTGFSGLCVSTPENVAAALDERQQKEGAQAQKDLKQTPCQPRRKRPTKKRLIGDPDRVSAVASWQQYRRILIAELAAAGATPLQRQIAEAQTDPEWPRIFPAAVNWPLYVWAMERPQKHRRKLIREIMPALTAVALGFEPVPATPEAAQTLPERRAAEIAKRAREQIRAAIAERVDAVPLELLPAAIADRWTSRRVAAALYPVLLCAGKMAISEICDEDKTLFEQVATATE